MSNTFHEALLEPTKRCPFCGDGRESEAYNKNFVHIFYRCGKELKVTRSGLNWSHQWEGQCKALSPSEPQTHDYSKGG